MRDADDVYVAAGLVADGSTPSPIIRMLSHVPRRLALEPLPTGALLAGPPQHPLEVRALVAAAGANIVGASALRSGVPGDAANGDYGDYDRPLELDLGRAEVKGQRRGKGGDPTSTRSAG